jgi:hypothetical protein
MVRGRHMEEGGMERKREKEGWRKRNSSPGGVRKGYGGGRNGEKERGREEGGRETH